MKRCMWNQCLLVTCVDSTPSNNRQYYFPLRFLLRVLMFFDVFFAEFAGLMQIVPEMIELAVSCALPSLVYCNGAFTEGVVM